MIFETERMSGLTPKYDLVGREGPHHDPTFTISVTLGELVVTASGRSKKSAKAAATQVRSQ